MNDAVVTMLNAFTLISILMLIAMGLAVIYGLMNIINLAHGEFVMIGAYCAAAIQAWGGSFWWSLILAPAVGYALGLLLEKALISRIYHNQVSTILATWGLGLVLQQVVQFIFGPAPQPVNPPTNEAFEWMGISYPLYRLMLMGMAVAVVGACAWVYKHTNFGLDVRAAMQNREMAESLGIDTAKVYQTAFAAGAALAALAGALLAPITVVVAQMGINYLARSFFVVILGGSGSVLGVAVGSGLVGGTEVLLSHEIPASVAQALVLLMAAILTRYFPQGILAIKAKK